MIHRIYSSDPRFKALTFHAGFNVLLADKSPGATDQQTRNRAGKSSVLEIVHFLLGGNRDKDSLFHGEALEGITYGMDLDVGDSRICVERTVGGNNNVQLKGIPSHWSFVSPPHSAIATLSNDQWKVALAQLMFGLGDVPKNGPSFRSLISYFARRDRTGGMAKAVAFSTDQQLGNQQVNVSFLLGLDWTVPHAWFAVRDREKQLRQLRKSLQEGAFGSIVGTAASMKSELVVAQDRAEKLRSALANFKVEERYSDLEKQASQLTRTLSALMDENTLDRRYIAQLEDTLRNEAVAPAADLERLYSEAGVVLPDIVMKRFAEVATFHDSVIKNRRSYLTSEIRSAGERIQDREKERRQLDDRRAAIMEILNSTGALEHYTALQTERARLETHVELLRQKHDTAEALESGRIKLKAERNHLLERLRRSFSDEDEIINNAILTFSTVSAALYGEDAAGALTLTATANGPRFDPRIPGAKSKGVNNMQIFCFDIMLVLLGLKRKIGPGFLVHDSHLFDGVDERQIGKALALGTSLSVEHGFQYIVTMNTDDIPKEVPSGFSVEAHAIPVRLTDATEDGGLFGFRFN